MCGIFGDVTRRGHPLSIDRSEADRLRDTMASRGPDGASTWHRENVLLGHRRLSVRTAGPSGEQPLLSADGRWVVVFNGELYEEASLRAQLASEGFAPSGDGDAATVLAAVAAWGSNACARLRGMFALAAVDLHDQQLWLARDPLGMKPLYWWADDDEVVFASSPTAVLEHPRVPVAPDLAMVSTYLSTLRTELEGRTLFDDVHSLRSGEVLEFDLERPLSRPRSRHVEVPNRGCSPDMTMQEGADLLRQTLSDSVSAHLDAKVPVACLFSGGLDSTGIAALAQAHVDLPTYCAGTRGKEPGDLEFAQAAASDLGLEHSQVEIDGARFDAGWRDLIQNGGLPLSTPNEVAILAVCRALRADGNIVALSGEGADEILGGYDGVMRAARQFEEGDPGPLDGGRLHLELGAWIAPAVKPEVLHPDIWSALDNDQFVVNAYRRNFERAQADTPPEADPLEAHLRFLRRTNMAGLLSRLDRASMAAGVEGRTPFADREVVALAESMPVGIKVEPATSTANIGRGKRVLRQALANVVPRATLERPKASFPLPFQNWLAEAAQQATASPFARSIFEPRLL
ncbi:MAG: asparagine synthase (glutamine-hydrolyzing), partial [Chlamydiales bacterium]